LSLLLFGSGFLPRLKDAFYQLFFSFLNLFGSDELARYAPCKCRDGTGFTGSGTLKRLCGSSITEL
jgi:hypothetical protein